MKKRAEIPEIDKTYTTEDQSWFSGKRYNSGKSVQVKKGKV